MSQVVEVVVNVPQVSGVYHYHLPPELEGEVQVGELVLAPFGPRIVQGVVTALGVDADGRETKAVQQKVAAEVALTAGQIELARRMAHDCLAPLAACIGLMFPPGVDQQADVLYAAQGRLPDNLTPTQTRLLKLLYERGPLRGQQIDRAMPRVNWRSSARSLVQKRLLTTQAVLTDPRVRPKLGKTVQLAVSAQAAEAALPTLGRAGTPALERRQAIIRFLLNDPGPVDVSWVYAGSGGNLQDLKTLAERGLVALDQVEVLRDPLGGREFQPNIPPELTADQQRVWGQIEDLLRRSAAGESLAPALLHGVTGSGKTEMYLRAVQRTLDLGRQAIVLVPEIALTPQTIRRFAGRFPGQAGVIHSGLSEGERFDTWRRARSGELNMVVGPRSALFTPFERLGLIVVDECHDDSYYQSEAPPHFHAREAAVRYAEQTHAVCLLGSATPDVGSMYHSRNSGWHYLQLPRRILAHKEAVRAHKEAAGAEPSAPGGQMRLEEVAAPTPENSALRFDLPPVSLVDMRLELKEGNRSIFSRELHTAIEQVLQKNLQAILFLNRRGSATYVFCRDCGYTLKCPNCDIPLTYHEDQNKLRCHYCSYDRNLPAKCPACGGTRIRQFGTGTQKVEADVQALFPGVRTLRWDYETTRHKGAHEAILNEFAGHHADVLVGTQMLAKGLDLPLVTLVGVILADVGLNMPDYRAGERTFQVLTQVAGRAGRSPLGGKVILQTFQPEHYVIQSAAGHDYAGFFQQEIAYREQLNYPPFANLARLEFRHFDAERAEAAAQEMAARLTTWIAGEGRRATRLIGPAPCFFARISGMHRWHIVVVGPDPAGLLRGRELGEWRIEINPPNLL